MIYIVVSDPGRRLLFRGQSLELALQIDGLFQRFGVETIWYVSAA